MANTTKKTTAKKEKDQEVDMKVETQEVEKTNEESALEMALAEIERLKKINKALEETQSTPSATPVVVTSNFASKRVKCINMLHNPVGVSTEPWGQGKVYYFEKYGQSLLIKFDDLVNIVASYPNTMERGHIYIADSRIVEELGLTEEYKTIYNQDLINKICAMNSDESVDLFVGAHEDIQESIAVDIAKKMAEGQSYDLNLLDKIKSLTGRDIIALSNDIKEETQRNKE